MVPDCHPLPRWRRHQLCGESSFRRWHERQELALLGQAAEHDYPGVKCGIMDQFANMLGKENHIVRIDCMTTETDYLPLELNDYELVLVYSNVQHA